jgi:hypothetical protein
MEHFVPSLLSVSWGGGDLNNGNYPVLISIKYYRCMIPSKHLLYSQCMHLLISFTSMIWLSFYALFWLSDLMKFQPNILNTYSCTCSMEDLPDALLGEIIKWLTSTSDLNSFSLVSKKLYTVEAELRDAIRVGCGVCPVTVALAAIGSRFSNLCKVEFNYSG